MKSVRYHITLEHEWKNAHSEAIWHLEPIPNYTDEVICSCSTDRTIRAWIYDSKSSTFSPSSAKLVEDTLHQRSIRCISFSQDGKFLTSCGFDGQTNLYKKCPSTLTRTGEVAIDFQYKYVTSLEGHENEVKYASWSMMSDCTYYLATCGRDKTIWIWELTTSNATSDECEDDIQTDCIAVLQEHSQDVKQVLWHPFIPKLLFSCSADDTIRIWKESDDLNQDFSPGEWYLAKTLAKHQHIVWSIDISLHDRGRWLASVSENGSICIWDAELDWQCIYFIPSCTIFSRPIYTVKWCHDPSTKMFAIGGGDDAIYIYQWKEDNRLELLCAKENAHTGDIDHLYWTESLLFSCGDDKSICAWSINKAIY